MGEEAALMGSGNHRTPEEIRAEIEQTKAQLTETVNVLKERLSAEHLKKEIIEKVRSATVGRARKIVETSTERAKELGSTVAGAVQKNVLTKIILDHPIPAVLVGIGIAWLIWRNGRKSNSLPESSPETQPEGGARKFAGSMRNRSEEAIGPTATEAQEMGRHPERAEEAVGEVGEKPDPVFGPDREKAARLGAAAQEKARVLKERTRGMLLPSPLLLAAAGLGAGLIIGFILPGPKGCAYGRRE